MDTSMNATAVGRAANEDVVAGEATQSTSPATPDLRNDKRLNTARARVALWGGTLFDMKGDNGRRQYVVTRWAMTRAFADFDEVDAFLRLVGAPS